MATPAKRLKKELSCSLCQEYFMEPVCIDCGHNFCKDCIIRFWGEQETGVSCPQCGVKSEARVLRPNKELGAVAAIAKQMHFETLESGCGEKMCEVHQKPLELFCKDEVKLLCPSCPGSEEHETHILVSVEEAAEDYKQKLQIHLQALLEEREKVLDFQTKEEKRNEEFLGKLEGEKQKIVSKFEELESFLKEQKKAMLDHFDKLVKEQKEFATRISTEICIFDTLIREVEEKCKQPASVFLQDIDETLSRFKIWEFQQPPDALSELEEKLCGISKNYFIVQMTVENFKETFSPDAVPVKWVKVTLAPDTAGSGLEVSADQKTLRVNPRAWRQGSLPTQAYCVLGCERFTSGRHYWEVKVGEEAQWAVGVARESVKRQQELKLKPEDGVWVMEKSLKTDVTSKPAVLETVGIFLDYKLKRVVFFDADRGMVLRIFHSASLQHEKLRPFFWLQVIYSDNNKCYIQLCP